MRIHQCQKGLDPNLLFAKSILGDFSTLSRDVLRSPWHVFGALAGVFICRGLSLECYNRHVMLTEKTFVSILQ